LSVTQTNDVTTCAVRSIGQISEEVAQEALLELVSTTRCYGTSAAREMDIYRIIPSCALHVRCLERAEAYLGFQQGRGEAT